MTFIIGAEKSQILSLYYISIQTPCTEMFDDNNSRHGPKLVVYLANSK